MILLKREVNGDLVSMQSMLEMELPTFANKCGVDCSGHHSSAPHGQFRSDFRIFMFINPPSNDPHLRIWLEDIGVNKARITVMCEPNDLQECPEPLQRCFKEIERWLEGLPPQIPN